MRSTDVQPRRSGSKIGWVGVIAVAFLLFILVGLLLPAIAQIREAARRVQCQNNLKQLALSVQFCESAFKRLPVGIQVLPGGNDLAETKAGNWSWSVWVIPYVEASPYYDILNPSISNSLSDRLVVEAFKGNLRIDPNYWKNESTRSKSAGLDYSMEAVLTVLATGMVTLRCPSDFSETAQNDFRVGVADSQDCSVIWPGSNKTFNLGITNYVAANSSRQCYGLAAGSANGETISDRPDGMFSAVHATRLDDIGDGDSNTVIFSERMYGSLTPENDRSRFGRVVNTGAATVFGSRGIGNSTIDGSSTNDCADAWGAPDVLFGAWGGINLDDPEKPWRKFQGVSSFHSGGVNIALADGAVRFLENIAVPDQIGEYDPFESPRAETAAEDTKEHGFGAISPWRLMISANDGANIDYSE